MLLGVYVHHYTGKYETMIKLVISGGQSGADLAGNVWAKKHKIDTEVRAFYGFHTYYLYDEAILKQFRRHDNPELDGIKDPIEKLRRRTYLNVKNSDATLIFINRDLKDTRGSKLTARYCRELVKPHLIVNLKVLNIDKIIEFLMTYKPEVLNVAGERFVELAKVVQTLDTVIQRIYDQEDY